MVYTTAIIGLAAFTPLILAVPTTSAYPSSHVFAPRNTCLTGELASVSLLIL